MLQAAKEIEQAHLLAQSFGQLVRERKHQDFDQWVESAKASDIRELKNFAVGLLRDKDAVLAALKLPWSNGQVEGQVNRLKLLKRTMYGRANMTCYVSACWNLASCTRHEKCGRAKISDVINIGADAITPLDPSGGGARTRVARCAMRISAARRADDSGLYARLHLVKSVLALMTRPFDMQYANTAWHLTSTPPYITKEVQYESQVRLRSSIGGTCSRCLLNRSS